MVELACNREALTQRERARRADLVGRLGEYFRSPAELPEGYAFVLPGHAEVLLDLAEWIGLELRCCPFLTFAIDADASSIGLSITGSKEVKEFVRAEFVSSHPDRALGAPAPSPDPAARLNREVDKGVQERNAASRARLHAIAVRLSDKELSGPIDGPWTLGALLAHLAFWDRFVHERWKLARKGRTGMPGGFDDAMLDLVNEAALPQWVLVPPQEAVRQCFSAAEELDRLIVSLDEGSISRAWTAGRKRLVDRSLHRTEHLETIEAALPPA